MSDDINAGQTNRDLYLYPVEDVAQFFSVSTKTVRRMMDSGELKSVRVRGRRLISHAALGEYLQAQKQQA
uniref:Helix-turn-helix domain-containing protein n=1 Tax=Bosea sp. NBC_00436 TaxID=2969620 RepID=A0A9E8CR25_9HYPH